MALGEAGASVYCTGRSTRERRSEYDRAETTEETAELVTAAGGVAIAVAVDRLEAGEVEALAQLIDAERGRLDILIPLRRLLREPTLRRARRRRPRR